jgi:hypothetical protein
VILDDQPLGPLTTFLPSLKHGGETVDAFLHLGILLKFESDIPKERRLGQCPNGTTGEGEVLQSTCSAFVLARLDRLTRLGVKL